MANDHVSLSPLGHRETGVEQPIARLPEHAVRVVAVGVSRRMGDTFVTAPSNVNETFGLMFPSTDTYTSDTA